MNKKRKSRSKEGFEVVRLWTYDQAKRALPYIRSVGSSLREHWLDTQEKSLELARLGKLAGRPDKQRLLSLDRLRKEHGQADGKFQEALQEMLGMHVFPIDVNQGLAFIPFREKEDLAWYVFDLFDPEGMRSWRFHTDPLEQRRPIAAVGAEIETSNALAL